MVSNFSRQIKHLNLKMKIRLISALNSVAINQRVVQRVYIKMAQTINKDRAKVTLIKAGSYTDVSCFGKVAHYLKQMVGSKQDNLVIKLYSDTNKLNIVHALLYDPDSKQAIVDSSEEAGGRVVGNYYIIPTTLGGGEGVTKLPLASSISLRDFRREYFI